MKYHTIPFTNITEKAFVGRFQGFDFEIEPGKTRYFPSELSKHLAGQLVENILNENRKSIKDLKSYGEEMLRGILGAEVKTKEDVKSLNYREEVSLHEKMFEIRVEEGIKEKILKQEKAIEIAERND